MRLLLLIGIFLVLIPRMFAIELSLGHFVGTNHPMHREIFLPLAERLASESRGALTLRIVPDIGNPPRQWDRVLAGEFDLVFGLPGYTPERFPRTRLIELPSIARDSAEGTRMLDRARERTLAGELSEVVPLALWVNEPSVLLCRGHRIRRPTDLTGLRIRASDPISARVLELWGATPVLIPVNQIVGALGDGKLDGVLIGASGIAAFHLESVTDSCTFPLPVMLTSFYLAMNRARWDALLSEEKAFITSAVGPDLGLAATAAYERAGVEGFETLRAAGAALDSLSAAESDAFWIPLSRLQSEVVSGLAVDHVDGQQILDNFRPRLIPGFAGNNWALELKGAKGLHYSLEGSMDFTRWGNLGERVGGANGSTGWIVPMVPGQPTIFRVLVPWFATWKFLLGLFLGTTRGDGPGSVGTCRDAAHPPQTP
ncbi:MAG: hypothetical protein U1G08_13170 [Verrucomicrobiota bacterium]